MIFIILVLALAICSVKARNSQKAIGPSVSLMLVALIPPIIGNLIIVSSTTKNLAVTGYYIYFLGMDLVMYAVLRFTFDYCHISWPNKGLKWVLRIILAIDIVQMLCNPFFGQAFGVEAIIVEGAPYYRLLAYAGQTFHRVVDYGIFAVVLIIFAWFVFHAPRISIERYLVIFLTMVFTGIWETFYIFSSSPIDRSMVGFGVFGLIVYYFSLYFRPMRLLDRMLASIASGLPEALFFFDSSGQCIWANKPGILLSGVSENNIDRASEKLLKLFGNFDKYKDGWTKQCTVGEGDAQKSYHLENHTVSDERGRKVGSFLSVRDNTVEQRTLRKEIYNATHDSLTGAYNRAGYDLVLPEFDIANTCFILLDGDNFKNINDTYGHETGDDLLRKVVKVIKRTVRSDDFVCRIGGDEFVVLMSNMNMSNSGLIISKIEQINRDLSAAEDGLPAFTMSAGIAFGSEAGDFKTLFEHADKALYETKHRGRNGYTFYSY